MTDLGSLPELPRGVSESIQYFERGRQQLYEWLSRKTAEDVSVLTYQSETARLVSETAEIFAEASTSIVEVCENQRNLASFLIAGAWFDDSQDRLSLFAKHLPSDVCLDDVERPHLERTIIDILDKYEELDEVYGRLESCYFEPVASDIGEFLTVCHAERERRVVRMTRECP